MLDSGEHSALARAELRVPKIDDKNNSLFVRFVPHLMVIEVVENQAFSFAPSLILCVNSDAAVAFWDLHAKVASQPEIGGAAMGGHAAVRR